MGAKQLVLFIAFTFSLSGMAGNSYYVKPTGSDAKSGVSWDEAFQSVNAALAKADDGDTICLAGGEYEAVGGAYQITKDLTLVGGYQPDAYERSKPTVLRGKKNGNSRVLIIHGTLFKPIHVVLQNLTVTGGYAGNDGTIHSNGILVIANCGGGIYNRYANTEIRGGRVLYNVTAEGNNAGYGGGIYHSEGSLTLAGGTEISGNIANGKGGGIFNNGGTVAVNAGTVIKENIATTGLGEGYGGGIANNTGTLTLSNGVVIEGNEAIHNTNNKSTGYGGGIYSDGKDASILLSGNVLIKNNKATTGTGKGIENGVFPDMTSTVSIFAGEGVFFAEQNADGSYEVEVIMEEDFRLDLTVDEKYRNTELIAVASNGSRVIINKKAGDGQYTLHLTHLTEDVTVDLSLNYIVALPSGVEHAGIDPAPGNYTVPIGGRFEFTVTADEEYRNTLLTVFLSSGDTLNINSENEGKYVVSLVDITENITVDSMKFRCMVTFDIDSEYTVIESVPEKILIALHDDLEFFVKVSEMHLHSKLIVFANGKPLTFFPTAMDGRYYILMTDITGNTVVKTKIGYPITFPAADKHVSITGDPVVTPHEDFTFTATVDSGYRNAKPVFFANGDTLKPDFSDAEAGRYDMTLPNVSGPVTIEMILNYTLTFDAVTVEHLLLESIFGDVTVTADSYFNFIVIVEEEYRNALLSVHANEASLIPTLENESGPARYRVTVPNIRKDTRIELSLSYHTATLLQTDGITTDIQPGKYIVSPVGDFDFTFTLDEGYNHTEPIVIANGKVVTPERKNDGSYKASLSAITEDKTIMVRANAVNSLLKVYFTLPKNVNVHYIGYRFSDSQSLVFVKEDSARFSIETSDNLKPEVLVNGKSHPLTLTAGKYELFLQSISEDTDIKILTENTGVAPLPENAVKVYSRNGFLVVESSVEVPVTVYAFTGQIKIQRKVAGTESIALPKGLYLVKTGTETRKITVND
ncbi:Type V secretory pathway, adhesin AidA [Bacteroidales bacterium Barb6]|nr:Type V secretory pathway, adhesin AidA [Bacteroidales bacterium Barb6]